MMIMFRTNQDVPNSVAFRYLMGSACAGRYAFSSTLPVKRMVRGHRGASRSDLDEPASGTPVLPADVACS